MRDFRITTFFLRRFRFSGNFPKVRFHPNFKEESRIQALRNFFGQKGHRPPKSEGARMPMLMRFLVSVCRVQCWPLAVKSRKHTMRKRLAPIQKARNEKTSGTQRVRKEKKQLHSQGFSTSVWGAPPTIRLNTYQLSRFMCESHTCKTKALLRPGGCHVSWHQNGRCSDTPVP